MINAVVGIGLGLILGAIAIALGCLFYNMTHPACPACGHRAKHGRCP